MLLSCLRAAAILGVAGFASAASAQVLTQPNMSVAMAREIIQGVVAHCGTGENGIITVTVAVVDRAGLPVMELRGDNAAPHNWELAFRKAYTARTYRRPSIEWRDGTAGASEQAGQRQLQHVIPLGGGVPVMIGEDAIGAVGVSGAQGGQPADDACADAGVAAVADQLQ
jgi:uncharacterized protein GlcG (DUF336 family)